MSQKNNKISNRVIQLQKMEQLKEALGKKYQIKFGTVLINIYNRNMLI